MAEFSFVFWIAVAMAVCALLAKKLDVPYPIVMVIGGALLAFVPAAPAIALKPELIFILFLPPLLFAGGWETDWRDFRFNLRPILLLAIGCVAFTTAVVAAVAHAAFPALTWPAATVLGAILAPTDAIAAVAIMNSLSVPRRLAVIIDDESLVNDASSLVIYRFAVVATVTGVFTPGIALLQFVVVSVGGVAIGLAVGYLYVQMQRLFTRLGFSDPETDVLLTLIGPYAAYLPADALGVSGVLAAVAGGIYVSRQSPIIFNSQTRLLANSFWEMLIFFLNAMVFVLVGLQVRSVVTQLDQPLTSVLWGGALIAAVVILVRLVWIYPATYLPRLVFRSIVEREGWPPLSWPTLLGWNGMRGVVSLAAALALPLEIHGGAPFPGRNLIIFFTFCTIFATLVVQGLSLPYVIRWLGLVVPDTTDREEAQARVQVAEAAMARLNEMIERDGESVTELHRTRSLEMLRHYEERIRHFRSHLQGPSEEAAAELEHEVDHALKRATLDIERETIIQMRKGGLINDEIFRRIEADLDLAEAQLR